MGSEFSGGEPSSSREEQLIFMSDASAEAERLMSALRNRGYSVVEVPLALLVGRVSVQKPALILCDVDAAPALEQVRRLREVPGGNQVDIVFFGQPSRTLDELRDEVFHESSGFFVRPVDTFGLLRKVEALIGPPSNPEPARAMSGPSSRPPASLPRADSARPPAPSAPNVAITPSPPTPPSAQHPPSVPSPQVASTTPPRAPAKPSPIPSSGPSSLPPAHSSGPPMRSSSMPSPAPSLPQPIPLGFGVEPEVTRAALGRQIPQSEISAELEGILARAEQRVGGPEGSVRVPASIRLTPEAEVDAVLPADVLSALDEPLDVDEDDGDEGGGTGTGGGSASGGGGRTGLHTGVGTGAGARTGAGTGVGALLGVTAPGPDLRGAAGPTAAPPRRDSVEMPPLDLRPPPEAEEPPKTPPAVPTRPPEPPSWPPPMSALSAMTSVEAKPTSGREHEVHTAVLRPTPLPPAPTPEGLRLGRVTQAGAPPTSIPEPPKSVPLEIPQALGRGDSALGLARAIRSRFSGAVAFESDAGIRRVVLRDGDFVTAASGIANESLVAFLTERGTLAPDVQKSLGHKLPPFGRHAGAALIAHGHLRQDELWPVLRAHAEWLVGRVLEMTAGAAGLEVDVPARLQAEPAVFGGATGAEVYVEIVRRIVSPDEALARLGGARARLVDGPNPALLGECALAPEEGTLVTRAKAATLGEVLGAGSKPDLPAVLYALVQLGVLEALAPAASPGPRKAEGPRAYDALDEQALRSRILARKALVEEGDYFALLGVGKSATSYDVQRAYTELRREFEPSRILTASTANLRDEVDLILEVLDEAYEILSDQLRRERYRRALEATPS
ncbi:MAG: hypothetical protein KJ015_09580 [Myxococcales bacterium]|nr:hypothetical protein [Myxococcales bacterium]